jgi:hypothetical protein
LGVVLLAPAVVVVEPPPPAVFARLKNDKGSDARDTTLGGKVRDTMT